MTALKLGKGSAFVKSRLLRLKQTEITWEADFQAIPCPKGGHDHGHLGLVIAQDGHFLREATVDHEPDANDLADLLAHAMKNPHDDLSHRPAIILLRNKPAWAELLPHLGQLGIEVHLKNDLPALNQAFEEVLEVALESHDHGAVQDGEGLPVALTLAQRKAIAETWPEFADRLHLDVPNRTLYLNQNEVQHIHDKALLGELHAKGGMKRNSFRHIIETTQIALSRVEAFGTIPVTDSVYQFKVTLRDSNAPIWRRIQVKNCTLDKFHEAMQTSMGWTNSHLHHFRFGETMYGDPELVGEDSDIEYLDSTRIKLLDVLPEEGKTLVFEYEYDFGDSWYHDVEFEGRSRIEKGMKYPRCIDGARACPPEDVGGMYGYQEFCEAIADSGHERHRELIRWAGKRFDPEAFDPSAATRRMHKGLPDWRRRR